MPKPDAPEQPEVTGAGPTSLRITWKVPEVTPEVTNCTLKVRIAGSQRWQNYDHSTGKLVLKGGSVVPAPTCEVTCDGIEEGVAYEVVVAAMNAEGWGSPSQPSKPGHAGELKPREKPPAPGPPKLVAIGPGRMRCTWVVPRACPPVEASQVQVTDVSNNRTFLVEAASGKLVASGRTTFAVPRCEANINGAEEGVEYHATVCCRSAEGFGEYSIASDPIAIAGDAGGAMQLVLHDGPSADAPTIEPLEKFSGQMKVRWVLPEDSKSTMVKLRRTGDQNWYLCGGTAIPAPAQETIATGLEEGIEYEAMVAFLINGKWCCESGVSKPACIGEKKLPSIPGTPKEPRISIVSTNEGRMKVRWQLFTAVPPLTGAVVKFRAVGARTWQYVNPTTFQLVDAEPKDPVAAPASEVDVVGLTAGIRYEACVAFRNRLGRGPESGPSEVACLGRPIPKLIKCQYCFNDFDLQHAGVPDNVESFWCPPCRFRVMDPFNAVVEPYGLMFCHIISRPTIAFSVDLPDLKSWRKDDNEVYLRCVRIDSHQCVQVWPKKLVMECNGNEVVNIKEPEEGHVRRDVPKNIVAGLRPGLNTISITIEDDYLASYALALVRTQTKTALQIAADTPRIDEDQSLSRVMSLLADTWKGDLDAEEAEDDDELIACVISNKLKLRCPLSFERVVTPVRGEQCMHLQCFGLGAYLESNMKMRSLNNRWTCPVCSNLLKPSDLRLDSYVEKVLNETPEHVDEVLIMQDGSYRIIEEAPAGGAAPAQAKADANPVTEAHHDDGEVTVEAHIIGDGEDAAEKRKATTITVETKQPLRKRRRQKIQEAAAAADGDDKAPVVSDNDSD